MVYNFRCAEGRTARTPSLFPVTGAFGGEMHHAPGFLPEAFFVSRNRSLVCPVRGLGRITLDGVDMLKSAAPIYGTIITLQVLAVILFARRSMCIVV